MRAPASLRRISDPLLERIPVPILSGVNRGRWWNLSSAGSGYATGRRARSQLELFAALLRPGDTVWDVGAHHGYFTLCAASEIDERGSVHAFEPGKRNREVLLRHIRWNGLQNVMVYPYALSSFDGSTRFGGEGSSKTQALGSGDREVAVRTASSLVRSGECPPPTFVKVDIEGAEADFVEGATDVLPADSRLLIAVHGRETDRKCIRALADAGFYLIASRELSRNRTRRWHADPDLFAIGPCYGEIERDRLLLRRHGF